MTNNEKKVFAVIKGHFDMFGRAISENELYDNANMFPADFKIAVKSLLANGKIEKCGNSWLKPFGVTVKTGPVPSAEEIRPKPLKRKNGSVRRKKVCALLFAVIVNAMAFATPVVTDITAKQRFPWNGLVDITVTLSGMEEECKSSAWEFYATNKATNAAMPVASVNEVGTVTGEGSQWTRRFVWNAAEDVGMAKLGEVVLSVSAWKPSVTGVQLWKDGPFWADCNVGATKPEESGYYFWWGDTVGYKRNDANNGWVSVKDGSSFSFSYENASTYNKVKSQLQSMGYVDSFGNLVSAHDAATAQWGVGWRMPTDSEFRALISNCKAVWTTRNGVYGWFITGTDAYASKHIFLPAVGRGSGTSLDGLGSDGYYWSSTMDTYYTTYAAWLLHFNSSETIRPCEYRSLGQPVRSVRVLA